VRISILCRVSARLAEVPRVSGEVPRKFALQQVLYFLAMQKGIHLTREGGEARCRPQVSLCRECHPGIYMGDGLSRNLMNQ
jgi:hypothetical protein